MGFMWTIWAYCCVRVTPGCTTRPLKLQPLQIRLQHEQREQQARKPKLKKLTREVLFFPHVSIFDVRFSTDRRPVASYLFKKRVKIRAIATFCSISQQCASLFWKANIRILVVLLATHFCCSEFPKASGWLALSFPVFSDFRTFLIGQTWPTKNFYFCVFDNATWVHG